MAARSPSVILAPDRERRVDMPSEGRSGRGYEYGGPALPGGFLLGVGLGILLGDFFAWLFIGVGAGFILMGLIAAIGSR
jgi:hypothetical protein